MKKTILKKIRNIAISAVVLLIVLVGAGVGYAWYSGQHAADNARAFAQPSEAPKQDKVEPIKVSQTGVIGASIQMLTSPVTPGSNTSIMIRTNPEATCVIVVKYDNAQSKDSGLVQKKADEYGIVEWTWTVESSVPIGTWPAEVTCANQKNSAMVRGDLKVVKTLED